MDRNEWLAKALGYDVDADGMVGCPTNDGCMAVANTLDDFELWLESPEGQQAAHDRVRELWNTNGGEFGVVHELFAPNPAGITNEVDLVQYDAAMPIARRVVAGFYGKTEAEAWENALLWLEKGRDDV